jgi:hypothetical protein
MASFDLGNKIKGASALVPQTVGVANINSLAVDTKGFESVAFVATVGSGNTSATINAAMFFYESDDNTRANATALSASRIIENPLLNASNATFTASVVPTKRYAFVELDPVATFGSAVSITAILGDPHNTPTT